MIRRRARSTPMPSRNQSIACVRAAEGCAGSSRKAVRASADRSCFRPAISPRSTSMFARRAASASRTKCRLPTAGSARTSMDSSSRASRPISWRSANRSATGIRSAPSSRRRRLPHHSTTGWSSSTPSAATPYRARSGWPCWTSTRTNGCRRTRNGSVRISSRNCVSSPIAARSSAMCAARGCSSASSWCAIATRSNRRRPKRQTSSTVCATKAFSSGPTVHITTSSRSGRQCPSTPRTPTFSPRRSRRWSSAIACVVEHIITPRRGTSSSGVTWPSRLELVSARTSCSGGSLPASTTIDYANQIAGGLAAAHDQGVVHRDLKPENLFVTRDGRVKILDFGLAKLTGSAPAAAAGSIVATRIVDTMPGTVLGTVGYMSPEQVRGEPADQRTDIFSLGVVMYEMLSARRPFSEASAIETMSAIATKDPPDLSSFGASAPGALTRIVKRCLAKKPEDRFVSARDLAYALDSIVDGWTNPAVPAAPLAVRRNAYRVVVAIAALAIAGGIGAFAAIRLATPPETSFRRLTFQRGTVRSPRFAPDGDTVVYSAAWSGNASRVFVTQADTRDSSALDLPAGDLVATTSTGEIVLLMGRGATPTTALVGSGTLARASLTGGAARALIEGVDDADTAADGSEFAIVRASGERHRLEFPVGRVLYETSG